MTSWIPTQDRVLLKVDKPEEYTASGLTIPSDKENPKFDTGEIIKVGQISNNQHTLQVSGERLHSEIKPGRRAVFYKESGYPVLLVEDSENMYVVLNINDIYFVSDDPEAKLRAY